MPQIINLRPQENLNRGQFDLGSVPDTDSKMFTILDTDPLEVTFNHGFDRIPVAAYPVLKMGESDVWVTDINSTSITVKRTNAIILNLLIY